MREIPNKQYQYVSTGLHSNSPLNMVGDLHAPEDEVRQSSSPTRKVEISRDAHFTTTEKSPFFELNPVLFSI